MPFSVFSHMIFARRRKRRWFISEWTNNHFLLLLFPTLLTITQKSQGRRASQRSQSTRRAQTSKRLFSPPPPPPPPPPLPLPSPVRRTEKEEREREKKSGKISSSSLFAFKVQGERRRCCLDRQRFMIFSVGDFFLCSLKDGSFHTCKQHTVLLRDENKMLTQLYVQPSTVLTCLKAPFFLFRKSDKQSNGRLDSPMHKKMKRVNEAAY